LSERERWRVFRFGALSFGPVGSFQATVEPAVTSQLWERRDFAGLATGWIALRLEMSRRKVIAERKVTALRSLDNDAPCVPTARRLSSV
jgi:hypothetical protein